MSRHIYIVDIHILQIIKNTFLQLIRRLCIYMQYTPGIHVRTQNNAAWCRLRPILHPFHPIFSITAISDHIWPLQELDVQCSSYFEVCEIDINFHIHAWTRGPISNMNGITAWLGSAQNISRWCRSLQHSLAVCQWILSNPKETLQTLICGEAVLLQDSKGNITYTFSLLQSRTNQIN